jgi:DNA-binding SARP family transcriptional activator/pimeloyl-ACP methyl ester carboxylesterase
VRVRVLGPLELGDAAAPVDAPDRKARQVLTLLALAAPGALSVDRLASALWDDPPPSAAKTVQAHVSRARAAVVTATDVERPVVGGPAGYVLALDASLLDVAALDDLLRRGRTAATAGDAATAAAVLGAARALWRGEPELPATRAGDLERARLHELRLRVAEEHLAAVVDAGGAADAVVELEVLTGAEPLRERLWELRMLALYRSGRQSDALRAAHRVRQILADEIGVEPGPELRRLEAMILDHDPLLAAPAPTRRNPEPRANTSASRMVAATTGDERLPVCVPRYAVADGVHVAYGTYGDGPTDVLLLNPGFVPVDAYLEEPRLAAAVRRLARGRRVIGLDRRGIGLSDPVPLAAPLSLDVWVADVVAVLDAVGARDPIDVFANADMGLVALLLSAIHPERVRTLTLVNGYARVTSTDGYPHGMHAPGQEHITRAVTVPTDPAVDLLTLIAPSVARDDAFRAWWDRTGSRAASPGTSAVVRAVVDRADVRYALAAISAPVLLVVRHGCASYDPGHARHLAEQLRDATVVDLDDTDDPWWLGDVDATIDAFDAFLATR